MKRFILLLGVVVGLSASDWVMRVDEDGIVVETKSTERSDVDSFRGITTINAPLERVLEIIEDESICAEWIKYCKEEQVLRSIDANRRIKRTLTAMPWPLTDRDSVSENIKRTLADGKSKRIEFKAIDNFYPHQEDYVRIELLEGYWELDYIDANTTKVIYEVLSDPKHLPSWLVNSGVVEQPYETLHNLKSKFQEIETK